MTETSHFWGGIVTGDASNAPYTNDEITDIFRKLTQLDRDVILPVVHDTYDPFTFLPLNPMIVGLRNVYVNPGAAIVDGKVYVLSDGALNFDCSVAGYYRLVLRKIFPNIVTGLPTGQTVKLVMLFDSSGIDGAPLPTRVDGETWDVTVAMFRKFPSTLPPNPTEGTLEFYPVYQSNYASTALDEYGMRLFPQSALNIVGRQGSSYTDWSLPGTGNAMCGQSRIEVGAFAMSANPQAFTFAEPFAGKPIVIITPWYSGTPWAGNNLCISAIATTGFSVRADSIVSMDYIQYVAIGPV